MQLFYTSGITKQTNKFTFDKTESRHIVKVLRKKVGDLVFISDGEGTLFTAEILSANDKKCLVKIIEREYKEKTRDYFLHIAIAPTKLNDRFEWFLEKATEIGIDEITPIICNHSERKILKLERMRKIIQSAAKQSIKFHIPILNAVVDFESFINTKRPGQLFIAHCEETIKNSLKKELIPNSSATILIGPEGDFSNKEIQHSLAHKYIPVSLGESRLRTETAGLVAVHSTAFINE